MNDLWPALLALLVPRNAVAEIKTNVPRFRGRFRKPTGNDSGRRRLFYGYTKGARRPRECVYTVPG